ncbi:MAG TPA: HEAT repeat domain-containing protein [Candidatus Dormibacteraeota bacterium]|nr:HEAT repeat domain-containing protein [Candidatus Dormibacteraeota bacterium]
MPQTAGRVLAGRSRLAERIDRVLNGALAGEPAVIVNVSAADLLGESVPVARVISAALARPGSGLSAHWLVTEAFRHSGLADKIFDSLASGDPAIRAAACRLCGAMRLTESVPWIGDLMGDPDPLVRRTATRALGRLGGRRAVEILVGMADQVALHRLAITLAQAASDVDIEALMRQPPSEKAAVATVMACGLRRDDLRVPPLLGIGHDQRWPKQVRFAACKALAMIGDLAASDGLSQLATADPDPNVRAVAARAHRRLLKTALRRKL